MDQSGKFVGAASSLRLLNEYGYNWRVQHLCAKLVCVTATYECLIACPTVVRGGCVCNLMVTIDIISLSSFCGAHGLKIARKFQLSLEVLVRRRTAETSCDFFILNCFLVGSPFALCSHANPAPQGGDRSAQAAIHDGASEARGRKPNPIVGSGSLNCDYGGARGYHLQTTLPLVKRRVYMPLKL